MQASRPVDSPQEFEGWIPLMVAGCAMLVALIITISFGVCCCYRRRRLRIMKVDWEKKQDETLRHNRLAIEEKSEESTRNRETRD
eukprot:CFRG1310T1